MLCLCVQDPEIGNRCAFNTTTTQPVLKTLVLVFFGINNEGVCRSKLVLRLFDFARCCCGSALGCYRREEHIAWWNDGGD